MHTHIHMSHAHACHMHMHMSHAHAHVHVNMCMSMRILRAGFMEGQAEGGFPQPQRLRRVHGLLLVGHRGCHARHDAAGPTHLQGTAIVSIAIVSRAIVSMMLLGQRIFKVGMPYPSYLTGSLACHSLLPYYLREYYLTTLLPSMRHS